MGFDLFGAAAKSEEGEYFRRTICGWEPLADYILEHVDITENDPEMWHSNSGYEVSKASALHIAFTLENLLAKGDVARYERECKKQQGRGKRRLSMPDCPLEEEDVREFAEFCRESGGFIIL